MSGAFSIQYCGPYTIQTSDATLSLQLVESMSVAIDRSELKDYEVPIDQEVKSK